MVWRLAYLRRLAASPLSGSLTEDARVYWDWAGQLLRTGPLGTQPFFFGPLYPYLLALIRSASGHSPNNVLCLQAIWGSLAVVLIADAARRLTRPTIGALTGVIMCFYQLSVFFDGLILMESFTFFLESLLIWYVIRNNPPFTSYRHLFTVGLFIGLLTLGRSASGVLIVPAFLFLLRWRQEAQKIPIRAMILVFGASCAIAPVTMRNAIVVHEWIPITYNGGYNLFVGNNPHATGGWVSITGTTTLMAERNAVVDSVLDGREYLRMREGVALAASASSRYWAAKAWDFVRGNPAMAMQLTLRKLCMLWNRREYPQIENADVYRVVAGPLGMPWVGTFAFVGILALAGMLIAFPYEARVQWVFGYVVSVTLSIVPFFVTDRFRYHIVPGAALLAAVTLERVWRIRRSREVRKWLRLSACVAIGAGIVYLPAPSLRLERRAWETAADIGSRWVERGRFDMAVPLLEGAVAVEERERGVSRTTGTTGGERAWLHYEYGLALLGVHRVREATPWLERATRGAPDQARIAETLAEAYRQTGRTADADSVEGGMSSLTGSRGLVLCARGWEAGRRGRFGDAIGFFGAAIEENPGLYDAWEGLVRAHLQLNQLAFAESALTSAKKAGFPESKYWAYRAAIAASAGQVEVARDALTKIPQDAIAVDPMLRSVVDRTYQILGRPP